MLTLAQQEGCGYLVGARRPRRIQRRPRDLDYAVTQLPHDSTRERVWKPVCVWLLGRKTQHGSPSHCTSMKTDRTNITNIIFVYICFYVYDRIRIQIRIILIISNKIQFKYSNTNIISDVKYSNSDRIPLRPCLDVVGFVSIHMCWGGLE